MSMASQAKYESRLWTGAPQPRPPEVTWLSEPRAVPQYRAQAFTPSRRDIILTICCLAVSVAFIAGAAWALTFGTDFSSDHYLLDLAILGGMSFCTLSYQLSRVGAALRIPNEAQGAANPSSRKPHFVSGSEFPSVTVLIPTYREEPRVIRHTLLSAMISRYPNRRIVVLVDDPPNDQRSIERSLSAVAEVVETFRPITELLQAEYALWSRRQHSREVDKDFERRRVAKLFNNVAAWLQSHADDLNASAEKEFSHVDQFLRDGVVRELSAYYANRAASIGDDLGNVLTVEAAYLELRGLFCADVRTFQRKAFSNLPHEPNKAMNLNAYIGLMGGSYDVIPSIRGLQLLETRGGSADLVVPRPDFVLTLDADSILKSSYIHELTEVLRLRPRAAVAQTPYRTFPGAATYLERIAGATTDIQYLYHQGSTRFGASFWVGANALLRMPALAEIMRVEDRNGVKCKIFIQDDTVIEDTGSTIDLLHAGWHVYNHPEALAYSATPSDFGALAIQRRRWSNGGIIIAPRFYGHLLGNSGRLKRLGELLLRSNYLLSTLVGNLCVVVVMTAVDASSPVLLITIVAMAPYFVLYSFDLRRLGYRAIDVLGVCSLNLMLIPVCLGGVLDSILQLVTRRRGRFIRTPKVGTRTVIRPADMLFSLGVAGLMTYYIVAAVAAGKIAGATVPGLNLLLYCFGFGTYIGFRQIPMDLWLAVRTAAASRVDRVLKAIRLPPLICLR